MVMVKHVAIVRDMMTIYSCIQLYVAIYCYDEQMLQRIVGNGKCCSMYFSGVTNFKNQNFETKAQHTVNIKTKWKVDHLQDSSLSTWECIFLITFLLLSFLVGRIFFFR